MIRNSIHWDVRNFFFATDHKPLVGIFGDKNLADIDNPRLAKIKEKLMWWKFKVIHVPGKRQDAADAISRMKPAQLLNICVIENQNYDDGDMLRVGLNRLELHDDGLKTISWELVYQETHK